VVIPGGLIVPTFLGSVLVVIGSGIYLGVSFKNWWCWSNVFSMFVLYKLVECEHWFSEVMQRDLEN